MSWLSRLLFHSRLERDLDREIDDHIARHAADLMAQGVDPVEAVRRARVTFGGRDQIKEAARDVRGTRWVADFVHDCRHGLRLLRRTPAFTAVAVVSLALGIGANTAIFSLMDRLMFRALPVREPNRLVEVGPGELSHPLFDELKARLTTVEGLFGRGEVTPDGLAITVGRETELATFELVTGSYFRVLGVNAAVGRTFNEEVDRVSGASPVAVISEQYWRRRFASDPAVIGTTFRRLNTVFTIIGVMPAGFTGTVAGQDPDMTVPLTMDAEVRGAPSCLGEYGCWWISVMARVRDGRTPEQLRAELLAIRGPIISDAKASLGPASTWRIEDGSNGFGALRRRYGEPLWILMGTVGLVLLLACANLANLVLARSAVRQPEIVVRLAIGAGRGRIIRQLCAEGLIVALAGGLLGIGVAHTLAEWLVTTMSGGGGRLLLSASLDLRVFLFAAAVSLAASLLFSIGPAVHATRLRLAGVMAEGRTSRARIGKGLIVAQVALAVLLLVGAGLFGRTLANIYSVDAGFDGRHVLLLSTNVSTLGYPDARVQDVEGRVVRELRALPGVRSATMSKMVPATRGSWRQQLLVDGTLLEVTPHLDAVGSEYFATFGVPLVAGREFTSRDTAQSPAVAVVNEAFARAFLQGRAPLGRRVAFAGEPPGPSYEVVGIVKNVRAESLKADAPPFVYFLAEQLPPGGSHTFALRADVLPEALAPALRQTLARIDPALRPQDLRSMDEQVARSLVRERMLAALAGFFGGLALLLCAIGVYGVMAYQVSSRRREIGIRMALGAEAGTVARRILAQAAGLTVAGCALGAIGSLVLTRVVEGFLFDVRRNDPITLLATVGSLTVVALASAWLPGRSAARTDPVETLRAQ
jgi:predicted permease